MTESTEGTGGRALPQNFVERLKGLISELEAQERQDTDRVEMGEIELRISEVEALWFVAYRTAQ